MECSVTSFLSPTYKLTLVPYVQETRIASYFAFLKKLYAQTCVCVSVHSSVTWLSRIFTSADTLGEMALCHNRK